MPLKEINPLLTKRSNVKKMYIIDQHNINPGGAFTLTINTALGTGNSFQLPLPSGQTYNFEVNWGDGNSDTITAYNQAETLHTYSSGGTYQISISGKCGGWSFNNGGDRLKLISVDQWGDVGFENIEGLFYGCSNLTTASGAGQIPYNASLLSIKNLFRSSGLQTTDSDIFDQLTNVTDAESCFELSPINMLPSVSTMAAVTTFRRFAFSCTSLSSIANDYFYNNALVTTYQEAFQSCRNLSIPTRIWNQANITASTSFFKTFGVTNTIYSHTGTMQPYWTYGGNPAFVGLESLLNNTALTNYVDIPFEWKGMVEVGTLTTDQTTLQQVGINRTYSGIAEINWGDGTFTRTTSAVEALHDYSSGGTYQIKLGAESVTATTDLRADNAKISSIANLKSGLLFNLRLQSNKLTTLDLSSAPLDALLFVQGNPILDTITFASSGNGNLYYADFSNCNFDSLDFSNINTGAVVAGSFVVSNNPLTGGIIWKTSGNQQLAAFTAVNTQLPGLDFTYQPLKNSMLIINNPLLQSITFASSGNGTITTATLYNNDLSSLDFTNVIFGANATLSAYDNNNMNAVTLAASGNGTFKNVLLNNCNLSTFDFKDAKINQVAGDVINFSNNSGLNSITFAASGNGKLVDFRAPSCNLPNIDFSIFTPSDGVSIQLQNNSMASTEVDNQLINLDSIGWINGTLNLAGTNAARTAASDTAYNNLIANGWTITVN